MAKGSTKAFRDEGLRARVVGDAKLAKAVAEELQRLNPPPIPVPLPKKTVADRVLIFLEHGWLLMVMGTVSSFAGILIDGRLFTFLSIPILLGLDRSKALDGISVKATAWSYIVVLCIAFGLLWELGIATNKAREANHFPTLEAIVNGTSQKFTTQQKPNSNTDTVENHPQLTDQKQPQPIPKNPLQLLEYNSINGGVFLNNSDEHVFVINLVESVHRSDSGEQSIAQAVNVEIEPRKPHQFTYSSSPQLGTLNLPTDNWENEWLHARATFGDCLDISFFTPSASSFKMVVNHYQASHKPLPIGDAKGIVSYTIRGQEKTQEFPLKTLLMEKKGCKHS